MKLREETHHLGMTLLSLLLIFFFYLKEPFYLVIHREVNKPIKSLSGSSCILYNNGCTWCLFHQFFVGFDSYSTMRLLIQCTGEDGAWHDSQYSTLRGYIQAVFGKLWAYSKDCIVFLIWNMTVLFSWYKFLTKTFQLRILFITKMRFKNIKTQETKVTHTGEDVHKGWLIFPAIFSTFFVLSCARDMFCQRY